MIVDTSAVVALVQGERPHATLVAPPWPAPIAPSCLHPPSPNA